MTIYMTEQGKLYSDKDKYELCKFGDSINLKRSWIKKDTKGNPFYIITTKPKQIWAMEQGAVLVKKEEMTHHFNGKDPIKVSHHVPLPPDMEETKVERLPMEAKAARRGKKLQPLEDASPGAKWLRDMRITHNLSMSEAAQLCDLSLSHISALELDRCNMTEQTLLKLAKGFDVKYDTIKDFASQSRQHGNAGGYSHNLTDEAIEKKQLTPFAKAILQYRAKTGMKQYRLAEACGINAASLSMIERDDTVGNVSQTNFNKLEAYMNRVGVQLKGLEGYPVFNAPERIVIKQKHHTSSSADKELRRMQKEIGEQARQASYEAKQVKKAAPPVPTQPSLPFSLEHFTIEQLQAEMVRRSVINQKKTHLVKQNDIASTLLAIITLKSSLIHRELNKLS